MIKAMPAPRRFPLHAILVAASSTAIAIACEMGAAGGPVDDPSPGFKDLDGGQEWETGQETDTGNWLEPVDTETGDPVDGGDAGEDTASDDDCLNLAWDSYQVSGTCPDLPATGSIEQPEGCAIAIPGELGVRIGATGSVDGTLVTTERCSGIGAILAAPKVELVCVIDSVSCEVLLSGSANDNQ
jgi:hypothetical protein